MSEQAWLTVTDPARMLDLVGTTRKRKLGLFGVACCRRIPRFADDARAQIAIEISERYADRKAKIEEVRRAHRAMHPAPQDVEHCTPDEVDRYVAEHAVLANAGFRSADLVVRYGLEAAHDLASEQAAYCALLRDLFGNPFRKVATRKEWFTPRVRQLAAAIYEERGFDRLHILADALEEAGCMDAEILEHCRGPGPHVRGCWVVDLILSKD
jgi:hypothetical protein